MAALLKALYSTALLPVHLFLFSSCIATWCLATFLFICVILHHIVVNRYVRPNCIIFHDISISKRCILNGSGLVTCSGAQDDLKKVTEMAYDQIRLMGMNEKVGLVSFPRAKESQFIGQPYSQQTTQLIDDVSLAYHCSLPVSVIYF